MQKLLFICSLCFVIYACTPKVSSEVNEEVTENVPDEPVEELITNPCKMLSDLSPSERDRAETAYVLYRDQIKLGDMDAAYKIWKEAYYKAPAANGRVKYQFDDGVKLYQHFYTQAVNAEDKQMYFDSVMSVYNKRAMCFTDDKDYVAGRKAFDMYYYYSEVSDKDEMYALFKQVLDAKGDRVDYFVINPFTSILADKLINEEISLEEGRKYAYIIMDAVDYGTSNCGNKCEAWDIINAYAPARLENLEGIKGLYDCAYYVSNYEPIFRDNPEDCDAIKKVRGHLLYGGCDKNSELVQELDAANRTHCYTPPPPPGPCKLAYDAYNDGNYSDAVLHFDDCIESMTDIEKKAKYSLLVAKIYYGSLKNFSKARKYALQAASYKANWGEPFLLIGKLYASSGPLCGPGTGWDSQVVTWPAIDKFEYAKKIDPNVAAEANKWINEYTQYMPTTADIFQRGLTAGDKYKVPCWIKENTVIRAAK